MFLFSFERLCKILCADGIMDGEVNKLNVTISFGGFSFFIFRFHSCLVLVRTSVPYDDVVKQVTHTATKTKHYHQLLLRNMMKNCILLLVFATLYNSSLGKNSKRGLVLESLL